MNKLKKLIDELCPNGIQYLELREIFKIRHGYTPSKRIEKFWKNGNVPWFRMDDIRNNGKILKQAAQKVTLEAAKNNPFEKNSIILATRATIGEHALVKTEFICNQQFTCFTLLDKYKLNTNIKFMFYYFYIICEWCKKNTQTSSFPTVQSEPLKKLKIPVPPLEVQNEIVRILDKLDKSVNDTSKSLLTDLKMRQDQYKHYCDKLLTFERKQ
jgi:type I restriction enzyme S subunit